MRLFLTIAFSALFAAGLAAQGYYTVKFPDDRVIFGCGAKADTIWPTITQQFGCNFNVGISVKDQVFYTNDAQTCYKILRTWKLLYWCDYNPNWPSPYIIQNPTNTDTGPTVIANSDNHGYLQYTQVIKVLDNVPPVFLNCPTGPVVFCDYTNNDPAQYNVNHVDRCEGPVDLHVAVTDVCSKASIMLSYRLYLDLDGNGTMETYLSSSSPSAWPIETTVVKDTLFGKIKFPTGFGLPYGKHKIEWIANDNCAGEAICKYEFTVKDCKAPTVVCTNGLSVNIMQTGMITFWDTDFLQYTYDNCTPTEQIKIAISKSGTTTSFPFDNHSVTFDCTELGPQLVDIWAVDSYGNADFCQTFVVVQDHMGSCPAQSVAGKIATEQQLPVPGVKVKLKCTVPQYPLELQKTTDAAGQFAFTSGPLGKNYTVTPSLNTNPSLGVTTLDLLRLSAHTSGVMPLTSPYAWLAADVHHDNVIDDKDAADLAQLVTGQVTAFPLNTSWRFVPKTFVFVNPANPFNPLYPENIPLKTATGNPDFVGIKIGDLDGSVVPGLQNNNAENRSGEEDAALFTAPDLHFSAGEQVRVEVTSPDLDGLAGFQFTMDFDVNTLSLAAVEPGLVSSDYTGIFPDQGKLSACWVFPEAISGISGKNQHVPVFTLVFNARKDGALHDVLNMNATIAQPEVYSTDLRAQPAALQFNTATAGRPGAQLYPVQPNPAHDHFTALYYVPQDGPVTLRLTDLNGRVLQESVNIEKAGLHRQEIQMQDIPGTGMLLLHLESAGGAGVQKIQRM